MLLPIESTKKVFTFQWNAFKKAWKEKKYNHLLKLRLLNRLWWLIKATEDPWLTPSTIHSISFQLTCASQLRLCVMLTWESCRHFCSHSVHFFFLCRWYGEEKSFFSHTIAKSLKLIVSGSILTYLLMPEEIFFNRNCWNLTWAHLLLKRQLLALD